MGGNACRTDGDEGAAEAEPRGKGTGILTVNMTSLQLVTMNILAYRMEYGSQNPAEIIGVGIAATMLTTLVGTLAAKALEGRG